MDNLDLLKDKDVLRTNTSIEALKSLEKLDDTLSLVNDDVYQWKWTIIFLHNCVQAFMVLVLQGTNQADVVRDNSKDKRHIKKHLSPDKIGNESKLDNFMSLYEKIKDTDDTQLFGTTVKFEALEEHDKAMLSLNDFRNQFIHFFPCGWSLFINGLPYVFTLVIEIIKFTINDIGNFMFKYSERERKKIFYHLDLIDRKLKELKDE